MFAYKNKYIRVYKFLALTILAGLVGITTALYKHVAIIVISIVALYIICKNFSNTNLRLNDALLFILMFSGPPRFRARDPMASFKGETDWVVVLNLVIWGLGAVWVLRNLYSKKKITFKKPEFLALLFAFSLSLSIVVSISPLLTTFRVAQVFVMILFVYFWTRKYSIELTLRFLLLSYILIGITIFIAAFAKPDLVYVPYGESYRLRGDYIANAGAIGSIGLILILSFPVIKPRWILILFIIPMFVWILMKAHTRSAFVGFILFLTLLLLRSPRVCSLKIVRYFFIAALPAIIIYWERIFPFLIREEQSIYTLSDRTRVWNYITREALENNLLLGIGFCAERIFTLEVNPGIGTAHSSLMSVLIGGGPFAALIYIILLANMAHSLWMSFFKNKNTLAFPLLSVFLAVLAIALVSEEAVIATPTGFTFYLLVSLITRLGERKGASVNQRSLGSQLLCLPRR